MGKPSRSRRTAHRSRAAPRSERRRPQQHRRNSNQPQPAASVRVLRWAIRLLVLGVGLSAIAGTILSIAVPAREATDSQAIPEAAGSGDRAR